MGAGQYNFAFSLVRASKVLGSLLAVAVLLGVEPKQVYRWIAGLDQPPSTQRGELEKRLAVVRETVVELNRRRPHARAHS